jgi:hypothetical protein
MATTLMIAGVIIVAGSFVFAIFNMGRQAGNVFRGDADRAFSDFGGTFTRHLGAMVGIVIGGLMFFVGLIMFISQLFR